VAIGGVICKRVVVEFGSDLARFQKSFDLRREADYAIIGKRVVQRLDSQSIARKNKPSPRRVPNRKREHSSKLLDRAWAVFFVKMNDSFGVAGCLILMAARFKIRPQVAMVIDLAVVDDPHAAVFIRHRLMPARQIHDRQSPVPQPDGSIDEHASVVGSAMRQTVSHANERHRVNVSAEMVWNSDAANATHTISPYSQASSRVHREQTALRASPPSHRN